MALSMDLRERIVAAWEAGGATYIEVAERFQVDKTTVWRLLRRKRDTGHLRPSETTRGRKPRFTPARVDLLRLLVEQDPDATEQQLVDRLAQQHNFQTSSSAVGRALRKMNWTRKKRRSAPLRTTPSNDSSNDATS